MTRIPSTSRRTDVDGKPAKKLRTPDSAAVSDFKSALNQEESTNTQQGRAARKSAGQNGQQQPEKEIDQDSTDAVPVAAASFLPSPGQVLSNLSVHSVTGTPEHTPTDLPEELNAVIHQVAEEIRVGEVDGSRDLRITLKESVLPDTELRIVQEDGRLKVEFWSSHSEAIDRISKHFARLETVLNERFPGREFSVTVKTSADNEQPDQGQRSRGQLYVESSDDE